ncbi:MAG: MFS transporter [Anaerolineae bacterium]|nr:MFS transporter [Anaerolineae bacterium]
MTNVTTPILEQAADSPDTSRGSGWRLPGLNRPMLYFLLYNFIFNFGLYGVADVVLNFYFVSLGVPPETIGILQTLTRVGGILAGIPAGMLADRFGARRITVVAMIVAALSYIPMISLPSVPVMAFSRILLGLSFTSALIAATPLLVSLVEPRHRTHALSYYQIVSLAGTSLGTLAGGFLPAALVGIFPLPAHVDGPPEQSSLAYGLTLATGAVLLLVSILPLLPMAPPRLAQPRDAQDRTGARTPWLKLAFLTFPWLLFGVSAGLSFPFYNLFFRQRFEATDTVVGSILSLGWLVMGLVGLAAPWLEKRLGRLQAIFLTSVVAAIMFLALGAAETLPLGIVAYVIAASVRNLFAIFFTPVILDAFGPRLYSLSSGFGSLVWNVGYFASGTFSGFWAASYGFGFLMNLVAALVFVTAIVTWAIFARRRDAVPAGGAPAV